MTSDSFPYRQERALLLLAEMTTSGSLATGAYTDRCVQVARKHADVVIGLVAIRCLGTESVDDNDLTIFTTGVNRGQKGDDLGQQYQSPEAAVKGGSDFIIVGRGIHASEDPVAAARMYMWEGWKA
ncbi:hypothetical protein ACJZ2D_000663 [Fusarium nematophilum]